MYIHILVLNVMLFCRPVSRIFWQVGGGGILIFPRCSTVLETRIIPIRGREASEILRLEGVWGGALKRPPQRGPGRSPGNQRILKYPYTQNYIKKYIFYSEFRKKCNYEISKNQIKFNIFESTVSCNLQL